MKRIVFLLLTTILIFSIIFIGLGCKEETGETVEKTQEAEEVTEENVEEDEVETAIEESEAEIVSITVTSWRTDDANAMENILQIFMDNNPNINVEFEPIINKEYYAQLSTALETDTMWADVIGLHSYDTGRKIYEGDYLVELNDLIPELEIFSEQTLAAHSKDGITYAVPNYAVGHGFYYNPDIFDKYGLKEPDTWSELIEICDTLKENGETVFAQGAIDGWTFTHPGIYSYGPNFWGGEESRQKLVKGELLLTDDIFVRAFEVADSLTEYYHDGYESLDYVASKGLFTIGGAAMFMGGSWEIFPFRDSGLEFELGWFPPPVENEGDTLQFNWHIDLGYAMYKNTPNRDEVLEFLKWTTTQEYAQAVMENLPGFFSFVPGEYDLEPIPLEMLDVRDNSDLTERLVDENLNLQEPTAEGLMREIMPKLALKEVTPYEAAEYVHDSVSTWYEPWQ